MVFQLPKIDQRLSIVGHTGSGKTYFAMWALGRSGWLSRIPVIVIDYKRDKLLNSIERRRELKIGSKLPTKPGLYLAHPMPKEDNAVEDMLWKIWEQGNTGVYTDEAHMLPDQGALQALLTQGRSKSIPMITITQRPRWTSRFVFSEADYHTAFHLVYPDDRKFMSGLFNTNISGLPRFHSAYHVVGTHDNYFLRPVPGADALADVVSSQLHAKTLWL
jgi:hypothetical protein